MVTIDATAVLVAGIAVGLAVGLVMLVSVLLWSASWLARHAASTETASFARLDGRTHVGAVLAPAPTATKPRKPRLPPPSNGERRAPPNPRAN